MELCSLFSGSSDHVMTSVGLNIDGYSMEKNDLVKTKKTWNEKRGKNQKHIYPWVQNFLRLSLLKNGFSQLIISLNKVVRKLCF